MTTAGPGIVPRWEWRTFGDLGPVHDEIAALVTGETQVSDELYVLSVHRDASVKVRDGLLDVKLLDAVGEDGLELWQHPDFVPDLKAAANFLQLQRELTNTEDRIAAGRRFYNGNVRALNTRVRTFPSNLVASVFGFTTRDFFELSDPATAAPTTPTF